MPVSAVDGIDLSWERAGSGPRLLFCNGSGRSLADVQPMLAFLAGSFDVLAWDYRGFGDSDLGAGEYTMADVAADAAGLLGLVGWDACRVAGLSFGGMVAQELAVTNPERLERLALLCTSPGGAGGSSYPLQDLLDLPVEERAAAGLRLVDRRWDEDWFETHPSDSEVAARFAPAGEPDTAGALARRAQMEARARHDVWERLGSITCPTLVASGRYDGIAPVENGEATASRIRGAQFRVYDGGHAFLLQDPRALGDLVSFLLEE